LLVSLLFTVEWCWC